MLVQAGSLMFCGPPAEAYRLAGGVRDAFGFDPIPGPLEALVEGIELKLQACGLVDDAFEPLPGLGLSAEGCS